MKRETKQELVYFLILSQYDCVIIPYKTRDSNRKVSVCIVYYKRTANYILMGVGSSASVGGSDTQGATTIYHDTVYDSEYDSLDALRASRSVL